MPGGSPNFGQEGRVCNRFPTLAQNVIHTRALLPATLAAALRLRECHVIYAVCHVINITIAESNLEMGIVTQQTVCFSLDILAAAN